MPSSWRCTAIGALLLLLAACQHDATPPRPNVVFYLIDTLRADATTPYGSPRETTPFLAALAREGTVFEHCYAQAPWTKPSMGAILTSQYPGTPRLERLGDRVPSTLVTLPEALAAAGYDTVGFSANPIMGRMSGYERGFAEFHEAGTLFPPGNPIERSSGSAEAINRDLFHWLEHRDSKSDRPLFLYVHTIDPHEPYDPAPEYRGLFADAGAYEAHRAERRRLIDVARERNEPFDLHRTEHDFATIGLDPGPFMDYARRLYDADVRANDEMLGRLFARLRRDGLLDHALVIVTADHGEEFMEHGGTSHGYSLYDTLLRVPLVFWGPGIVPAGRRVAEPVESIDLYPTLLGLLGISPPAHLEGLDLRPLLRGEAPAEHRPIFARKQEPTPDGEILHRKGNAEAVIRYPWKLIRNLSQPRDLALPETALYRLDTDPGEHTNLAARHPDMVRELETELAAWRARTREDDSSGLDRPPVSP